MQLKNILIIGSPKIIQKDIDFLAERGYHVTAIGEPLATRENLLEALEQVPKEQQIIFNFVGQELGRMDAEIFGRFVPSLKLVAGQGAGKPRLSVMNIALIHYRL